VEGAGEGEDVGAAGVVADELHRRLHRLGARVPEKHPPVAAELGHQPLGQGHHRLVGEVGEADVDELLHLLPRRLQDLGVAVAGGVYRDAGHEVEVALAVDVKKPYPLAALGDEGVGADVARRDHFLVAF